MNWKLIPFAGMTCMIALFAACSVTTTELTPIDGGLGNEPTDGSKKDISTTEPGSSLCAKVCKKGEVANCSGKATCVADCEADVAKIPAACKDEANAQLECVATKATQFECKADGRVVAKDGCETESGALLKCLLAKPDSGPDAQPDAPPGEACVPQNVALTAADLDAEIGFKSASRLQGSCTTGELAQVDANFSDATVTTWNDLAKNVSAGCKACVVSADTSAKWQPVVATAADNGATGFVNFGACYSLTVSAACGKAIQYAEFCTSIACNSCTTATDRQNCNTAALSTGMCQSFAQALDTACAGATADDDAKCSSLTTSLAYICGP